VHGSGVIAVVVAALILGQRSTRAGYATRLQDTAVWKAVQLVLESFAFLLIGLQLPTVVGELAGISAATLAIASVAVLATVIVVRLVWVYVFAYLPRMLSARIREREPRKPTPSEVFIVAWAGMRGVVSLAAAFAVPLTTSTGAPFPGRPQLVFLTFDVVVGTLLLHGLTLPWLIRVLDVQSDDDHQDALQLAAAQTKAATAAATRLDEVLAEQRPGSRADDAAEVLRGWNERRQRAAWERLGRGEDEIGEGPAAAFKRLRLEMLAAERNAFIAERDAGAISDEVLRSALIGLDLEEASLNRN
jgi:CPA1 family monovalent cation:H+ antiporter